MTSAHSEMARPSFGNCRSSIGPGQTAEPWIVRPATNMPQCAHGPRSKDLRTDVGPLAVILGRSKHGSSLTRISTARPQCSQAARSSWKPRPSVTSGPTGRAHSLPDAGSWSASLSAFLKLIIPKQTAKVSGLSPGGKLRHVGEESFQIIGRSVAFGFVLPTCTQAATGPVL